MPDPGSTFKHRLVVRFRDCDAMGHVNHAVFFTYMEQTRLAWYQSLGGTTAFPGVSTIIVHAQCDYRAPAFMHEEIEIEAWLLRLGRSSISAAYRLTKVATGERVAEGETVSVTVDPSTHRPLPVPDPTRRVFEPFVIARGAAAPASGPIGK
jgi:YbgC/YbaW family acyl-CoA thioester hydrolase